MHVVRCFEDSNVVHVDGNVNPARDIETINLELIFSDVEILERRIAKVAKQARMDKTLAKELELLEAVKAHLENGGLAKTFEVPEDEDAQKWFASYNLLTAKPVIYAANVAEDDLADDGAKNHHVAAVRELAKAESSEVFVICAQIEQEIAELDDDEKQMFLEDLGLQESGLEKLIKASYRESSEVFVICAQIEQEIAELDDDEKQMFLEDLGLQESGLEKLIKASYSLLGLISYLTAGEDETRAWTIHKGTKAPQAAGKIHSDFERGFIRAEVVNYQDLLDCGSLSAAKEKGIIHKGTKAPQAAGKIHSDFERGFIRAEVVNYQDLLDCGSLSAAKEKGIVGLEGKEYVVRDGDVILFRFNV